MDVYQNEDMSGKTNVKQLRGINHYRSKAKSFLWPCEL